MEAEQIKQLEHIKESQERLTDLSIDYWQQYSSFNSWQFWFLVGILILSLITLYLFMDRRKALLLGFFGFNVHVWFTNFDLSAQAFVLWHLPYEMIPFLKGFSLDAAFVPVAFMLVYQWTLNHKKNYYLYATGLCLFLSFLWMPFLSTIGVTQMDKGISYFYLFLGDICVMVISKWITNIFVHFQKESRSLA
ncbi:hypothetical protein FH966_03405 [Lentibacillus cibarius]|uniref:Uncharacterized protein n=1 Tax=Lentibacillus cibarius TaxID=2583219 RepID=A0A549YG31_9BACI|nr:hypothetical protein [Lentibacillus cibarius]TRM10841.1 hypothetical protein FH966_03405 [Lentibacillus cibarius]